MTWIIDTKSKRRLSAKLVIGLAISAMFALTIVSEPASAQRGRRNDVRGYQHHWNGSYYRAPPVVYGSPYGSSYYGEPYYPPPVIYGPGIGIRLPGLSIGIY